MELVILRASDGKVRLGLVGDKHVRIMRAELLEESERDAERPTPAETACEVDDETAAENTAPPLSLSLPTWYADLPSIGGD